jgi:hypothetical protein
MGVGTKSQEVRQIWDRDNPEIDEKIITVAEGTTETWGPFQTPGNNQLVGAIRSDNNGTLRIQGSVLADALGANWEDLYTVALVNDVKREFVVDCTYDYIRIQYVAPAAPAGNSAVQINGNLVPVSALESNRAAASPDVVELALGTEGAVGRGTLTAAAAAVIVIPLNADRREATLRNWSTRTIYWGYVAGTDDTNGFPLDPKESYSWKNTIKEIYAFVPAGTDADYATDQQLR